MRWAIVTPPDDEPISLADAKTHLYLVDTSQDSKVLDCIQTAREHVESVCEHALMPQTWRCFFDCFPQSMDEYRHPTSHLMSRASPVIQLPGGHTISVDSVQYRDTTGTVQTLGPSLYAADLLSIPARLLPAYRTSWPATPAWPDSVTIDYQVGYDDPTKIPRPLRSAMMLIIGDLFENRESSVVGASYVETPAVERLLWPFKRVLP